MSSSQFVVFSILAILVTPLPVILVPRERQSPAFDRILWLATIATSFLGAWLGLAFNAGSAPDALNHLAISDVPIFPALLGALVGAFVLHLPLWITDRLAVRTTADADDFPELSGSDGQANRDPEP